MVEVRVKVGLGLGLALVPNLVGKLVGSWWGGNYIACMSTGQESQV